MAAGNPYAKYGATKIQTATPAELTLMLYDGAIKFCNLAIEGVLHERVEDAHTNIRKVQKIINYLNDTLDDHYPVYQDFEAIYRYLEGRLVEANIKKSTQGEEILSEVLEHLRTMRDTWKEVMRLARQA